jgi:hypothetical protein
MADGPSTWGYRVVEYRGDDETTYGIHEVYYDGAGVPKGMTETPALV